MEIALVFNKEEYNQASSYLSGSRILTGDYEVIQSAALDGIPCYNIWTYRDDPGELDKHDEAFSLCCQIANLLQDEIIYKGCSLVELTKNDWYIPLASMIFWAKLFLRFIREEHVSHIKLYQYEKIAYIGDPPEPPPNLLRALSLAIVKKENIPYKLIRISGNREQKTREIIIRKQALTACDIYSFASKYEYIVFATSDVARSDLCALLEKIRDRNHEYLVVLRNYDRQLPSSIPLKLIDQLSLKYELLDDACWSSAKRKLLQIIAESRYPYLAEDDCLWIWRSWLIDLSNLAIRRIIQSSFLVEATGAKVVIVENDAFGEARSICWGAKSRNAEVVTIEHVLLLSHSGGKRYHGTFAHIIVPDKTTAKIHQVYRDRCANICVGGTFRNEFKPKNSRREIRYDAVEIATSNPVHSLLMRASTEPIKYNNTINILRSVINRFDCISFYHRRHPRYDYSKEYYMRIFGSYHNYKPDSISLCGDNIQPALAIVVGNVSTVALEYAALGIPTLFFVPDIISTHYDRFIEGFEFYHDQESLIRRIEELLNDKSARVAYIESQLEFLRLSICCAGQDSLDHFNKFIQDIQCKSIRENGTNSINGTEKVALNLVLFIHALQQGCHKFFIGDINKFMGWMKTYRYLIKQLCRRVNEDPKSAASIDIKNFTRYMLSSVIWQPWRCQSDPTTPGTYIYLTPKYPCPLPFLVFLILINLRKYFRLPIQEAVGVLAMASREWISIGMTRWRSRHSRNESG